MEDIDAIKGLGDQAPTETKPLLRPSPYSDQAPTQTKPLLRPSPYGKGAPTLSISITFFENWYYKHKLVVGALALIFLFSSEWQNVCYQVTRHFWEKLGSDGPRIDILYLFRG
jgi:hypothetical protein